MSNNEKTRSNDFGIIETANAINFYAQHYLKFALYMWRIVQCKEQKESLKFLVGWNIICMLSFSLLDILYTLGIYFFYFCVTISPQQPFIRIVPSEFEITQAILSRLWWQKSSASTTKLILQYAVVWMREAKDFAECGILVAVWFLVLFVEQFPISFVSGRNLVWLVGNLVLFANAPWWNQKKIEQQIVEEESESEPQSVELQSVEQQSTNEQQNINEQQSVEQQSLLQQSTNECQFLLLNHNESSPSILCTEEVYENQRWWLFIGWTQQMLSTERPNWSKEDGSFSPSPEQISQTYTKWLDEEWMLQIPPTFAFSKEKPKLIPQHLTSANDGWEYSTASTNWNSFQASQTFSSAIRRRKWIRRREK